MATCSATDWPAYMMKLSRIMMNSMMPLENDAEPVISHPIQMRMNAPSGHGRSHLMGRCRPTISR